MTSHEYTVEVLVTTRMVVRCFGDSKELAQDHADQLVRNYWPIPNMSVTNIAVEDAIETRVRAKRVPA